MVKLSARIFSKIATILLVIGAFSLLTSHKAYAEQVAVFGKFEIHYNAFSSSFLTPKVAQEYGFNRSKRLGLINVSVLEVAADGSKKPTTAILSGEAKDLAGRSQAMNFRKVDEGNAIYYLSQFGFSNDTLLRFTLLVQADPNKPSDVITFEQRFFTD